MGTRKRDVAVYARGVLPTHDNARRVNGHAGKQQGRAMRGPSMGEPQRFRQHWLCGWWPTGGRTSGAVPPDMRGVAPRGRAALAPLARASLGA
jgi:hypothetical protein